MLGVQPGLAARQESQHGYHVIVLYFGARSHFSFLNSMLYNISMLVECCNENNNNNSINHQLTVLFIICAADHNYVKIVDKF